MPIPLMPLPYADDALAPAISAETLQVHHGKHHKGYVDKVNAAIEGGALGKERLEQVVAGARSNGDMKLFNNAAQAWNHGFYWASLTPKATRPSATLAVAISRDLGSLDALAERLVSDGTDHFASGWIWLVSDAGRLSIEQTHDAETFVDSARVPLLVLDLWEHAYYLDRKNDRAAYLKAATAKLINWELASTIHDSGERWSYTQE